ncbi:major facilitator superfamily domain-containing protein [Annulohypoxylon moriforme]|nr:major facilitator superfamily domain-containing protein [Annulohypoxylon moriforme]
MLTFLADTPLASAVRMLGGKRYFPFPEERHDFNIPLATMRQAGPDGIVSAPEPSKTDCVTCASRSCVITNAPLSSFTGNALDKNDTRRQDPSSAKPVYNESQLPDAMNMVDQHPDFSDQIILVDWYGPADPANPQNWSKWKKFRVHFIMYYVSVSVYMSASIYSPAQTQVSEVFGVSPTISSLGLALYVLGYGIGPMFFSPPSELPSVGRNIPYLISIGIFIVISIPTALAQSIESLLALRFFQGLFGSPILATSGASLSDVSSNAAKPYALFAFAMVCLAGPSIGTIIAGFSTPVLGWRWSLWEIMLMGGPGFILLLFLPETSHANILYRRAARLQAIASKELCVPKLGQARGSTTTLGRFYQSLVVPWKLNLLDPSISFTSIYCGLVYAIYYSFFEFFPLVYGDIYGMNLGEIGLVFISVLIAVGLSFIPYAFFIRYVNNMDKIGRPVSPEGRLPPAMLASFLIPAGIFIFAWTSRAGIHWIVPTIGTMLVSGNVVVVVQTIYVYITLSYPAYTASLFSGNGLIRGVVAFAGVLWSHPLYDSMGIELGMTVMGCCCALCIAGIFVLYFFGAQLRARSRFTRRQDTRLSKI